MNDFEDEPYAASDDDISQADMDLYLKGSAIEDTSAPDFRPIKDDFLQTLMYAAPNAILGGLAEFAESVTKYSEEEVKSAIENFTPDGMFREYEKHEEGFKTAGAIGMSIPWILKAPAIMRSKSLNKAVDKITGGYGSKYLLPSMKSDYDKVRDFREKASVLVDIQTKTLSNGSRVPTEIMQSLTRSWTSEVVDLAKIGVATDIGMYIGFSSNDLLFPDDMTGGEIALMYGLPNAVVSLGAGAMLRYKLKNVISDLGPEIDEKMNPLDLPLTDLISRKGDRGTAGTTLVMQKAQKDRELAEVSDNTDLATSLSSQSGALKVKTKEQIDLMAKDSVVENVTKSVKLDAEEHATIEEALKLDNGLLFGGVSFERIDPKNPQAIVENLEKRIKSLETRASAAFFKAQKILKGKKPPENGVSRDAAAAIHLKEYRELNEAAENAYKLTPFTIATDGSISLTEYTKQTFREIMKPSKRKAVDDGVVRSLKQGQDGEVIKVIKGSEKTQGPNQVGGYAAKFRTGDPEVPALRSNLNMRNFVYTSKGLKPLTSKAYGRLNHAGKTGVQELVKKNVADYDLELPDLPLIQIGKDSHHTELDGLLQLKDKYGEDSGKLRGLVRVDGQSFSSWDEIEMMSLESKFKELPGTLKATYEDGINFLNLGKTNKPTMDDMLVELNLPRNPVGELSPMVEVLASLAAQGVKDIKTVAPTLQKFKETLAASVIPRGELETYILKNDIKVRGVRYQKFDTSRKPVILLAEDHGINPFDLVELKAAALRNRGEVYNKLQTSSKRGGHLVSLISREITRDAKRFEESKGVNFLVNDSQLRSDRVVQTMSALENQPVIKAGDAITNATTTITENYALKKFEPYNKTFQAIQSPSNSKDLRLFELAAHQIGRGFRGDGTFTQTPDGGWLINLEKHPDNLKLLTEAQDVNFMPQVNINNVDGAWTDKLVLSTLAKETLEGMNAIGQDLRLQINAAREAVGLKPMAQKLLYLPPKNLAEKENIFLIDQNTGELKSIASGNTVAQAKKMAIEEVEAYKKKGIEVFESSDLDVQNYNILKLDDFDRMVDFSASMKQTGKGKGTSFGNIVETGPEVLTRMQQGMVNQYKSINKVVTSIMYEGELRAAEIAKMSSGMSGTQYKKGVTIWDQYSNRLLGKKSGSKEQTIGKFFGAVEDIYDKLFQKAYDSKINLLKGGISKRQADKEFSAMNPAYNPFKDSVEYMENTMRIKAPHNMIQHMSKLNNITGALMLRMFNLGLASINLLSLPTIIPIVAGALRKMPGETDEMWKKNNGAWGSQIDDKTFMWNPYKVATTGMHFFFTKEGREIMKEAGEKGHLWQKAVEQMQLFTTPSQSYAETMVKKAVDFTSIAVDKTEEWSRGIAYGTFYKLGKDRMGLKKENAMEFAHHMANRVIGDFRPNNRAQMFQGATGMPFGLFTTFAWNYFQRIFSYVEKGQLKEFMGQMGLQAAFFGSKALPGFNQYVENFTSNYDGDENLVDRLNTAFGGEATDAMMFGTIGSLTDSAFYTRADLRLPGSNFAYDYSVADMAPVAGLVGTTWKGISEIASSLRANEGLNEQEVLETLSRTFPIGTIRSWIQATEGRSIDSRGQIIGDKLNEGMSLMSKILGIKTIDEQAAIEEASRDTKIRMAREGARKKWRMGIRSLYRSGELDQDNFDGLIKQYGKATNGDYSNLSNSMRDEMEFALMPKMYTKALNTVIKESNVNGMVRVMNILSRNGGMGESGEGGEGGAGDR